MHLFRRGILVVAGLAATLSTARAQPVHFSVQAGPSLVGPQSQRGVIAGDVFRLTGAVDNGFFAAVAVERAFSSSLFTARAEAFFSQLTSAHATFDASPGIEAYQADRDQAWGAVLSLMVSPQEGRIVPYALAGLGWTHSRLLGSWLSADVLFPVDQSATGVGVLAGVGLRVRLGQTTYFVESRYGQVLGARHGSPFVPVALGIRW